MRAAKISKTTPCKVADAGRHSKAHLDSSGKSRVNFYYSEMLQTPRCPASRTPRRDCSPDLLTRIETVPAAAANERLRVAGSARMRRACQEGST
jgi:hypothetical protein